jgi:hypothetical protein
LNANVPSRTQETYDLTVKSDDVWQENFVIADLPVGEYELLIQAGGNTFRRIVTIQAGQTTFEVISTLFDFAPTAVPEPTIVPAETPTPEPPESRVDG